MKYKKGETVFFSGLMGSGKSALLIRKYNFLKDSGFNTVVYKPSKSENPKDHRIRSRNGRTLPCLYINSETKFLLLELLYYNVDIVIIDEVQFLGKKVYDQFKKLNDYEITVLCFGLDDPSFKDIEYLKNEICTTHEKLLCECEDIHCKKYASKTLFFKDKEKTIVSKDNNFFKYFKNLCDEHYLQEYEK